MELMIAKRDLEIAKKELARLTLSCHFQDMKEAWENYLIRLEKAWEYTNRTLQSCSGFDKWNQPYRQLRKKDPLLIYLKQARNSEMHSIGPSINGDLGIHIKDKTGRGLGIDGLSQNLKGGTLTINIETQDILPDVDVSISIFNIQVIGIENRDIWYNPPTEHLKKRIKNLSPTIIGDLGICFYSSYIEDAQNFLNKFGINK